jgi:biofilm PGA synthesis N-glycosyltransferase PgaC
MYICAAGLVLAGFLSLAGPVFRFNLVYERTQNTETEAGFSIVVAFRNEAENLPALYASICALNYPQHLIEWVLCNDHSEDKSKDWILHTQQTSPFRIIYCENTTETGKKAALHNAVKNTSFDTLFFTDADCVIPPQLLNVLNRNIKNKNTLLISGPVRYIGEPSFLHHYQCMESAVLMALTANSFKNKNALMANGANLCVKKSLFLQAQSERKDLSIPGGDDVFLLEYAMRQNPDACLFINNRENIIETQSESGLPGLLHQRARWASKVRFQNNLRGNLWQIFAMIFSLVYIASICLIPFNGWILAGILVLGKIAADIILQVRVLPVFPYPVHLLHITAYSVIQVFVILIAGIRSYAGSYTWKGRKY